MSISSVGEEGRSVRWRLALRPPPHFPSLVWFSASGGRNGSSLVKERGFSYVGREIPFQAYVQKEGEGGEDERHAPAGYAAYPLQALFL